MSVCVSERLLRVCVMYVCTLLLADGSSTSAEPKWEESDGEDMNGVHTAAVLHNLVQRRSSVGHDHRMAG